MTVKPLNFALCLALLPGAIGFAADDAAGLALFEQKIRPVLVEHCYDCHSVQAAEQKKLKGGLYVDSRDGLRTGGESGPAVVPGNVDASLIVDALKHETFKMPPAGKLPAVVVADFERWIKLGAPDSRDKSGPATSPRPIDIARARREHWAFQPLRTNPPPSSGTPSNPIDLYLANDGTKTADRHVLLRRVSFDLTGLPPTPDEIAAFVADTEPDAYERLVDRLLASPRYGERWGRHWLDLARYADSSGFHSDLDRPNAWRYRDYVIRSFNDDKPYAHFIAEQLAGDELDPPSDETRIATGFGCNGPSNDDNMGMGKAKEQYRLDILDDVISTTSTVFLGLTLGCSRCHDHKIDPLTSADYYRFLAIFNGTERQGGAITKAATKAGEAPAAIQALVESSARPRPTYLLRRGNLDFRGDEVQPGVPAVLVSRPIEFPAPTADAKTSGRRRVLAEWLGSPDNALVYRVLANRVWQHHFGRGLVATPSNFGFGGERPTHPELLDFLAQRIIDDGGRLKAVHRLIVTSAAYRAADVGVRRLEAESLRDAVLAVSRNLNAAMGGPGVKPRIRNELITTSQRNKWPELKSEGPAQWRRSVYIYVKRQLLMPMLELFDAPTTTDSCPQRSASVVPTQALVLMNDEFIEDQAAWVARAVLAESGDDVLARTHLRVLGKPATPQRLDRSRTFFSERQSVYQHDGATPDEARLRALADLVHVMFNASEFVYVE